MQINLLHPKTSRSNVIAECRETWQFKDSLQHNIVELLNGKKPVGNRSDPANPSTGDIPTPLGMVRGSEEETRNCIAIWFSSIFSLLKQLIVRI